MRHLSHIFEWRMFSGTFEGYTRTHTHTHTYTRTHTNTPLAHIFELRIIPGTFLGTIFKFRVACVCRKVCCLLRRNSTHWCTHKLTFMERRGEVKIKINPRNRKPELPLNPFPGTPPPLPQKTGLTVSALTRSDRAFMNEIWRHIQLV